MNGTFTGISILHICADYPYNKLYDLLISRLSKQTLNKVYVPSIEKKTETGYPVIFLGRDFGKLDRALFFRKQNIVVKDIEKRGVCSNIKIIHAHTLFTSGYIAWRLSKKYKIPYVVAVRNADVNVFFRYMIHLRSLGVRIMRDAAAVVFISPAYKEKVLDTIVPSKYKKQIEGKSYVIPNGINNYFLENAPQYSKTIQSENQIRLLYVGEVNSNKNVGTTLKACEYLEGKGFKPLLTIVGRVSESKYNDIKNHRLVEYYPQSPKEDLIKHYRQNDVFVMPSLNETFGLVYIEALSQGLPIIYSKGQGVDGYFKEGEVGYHVNSTDALELADAIERIRLDYTEISSRCINSAKPFSWDRIAEIYNELYYDIAKQTN